jgi:hypothetical protein
MEIELKNGERIILEVSPLFLEYIEDYKGGIEQLKKDAQGKKDINGYSKAMYATNQLLYAIIASNYDSPLTYRQAVRLVKLEDIDRIIKFINENTPNIKTQVIEDKTHRI